MPEYEVGVQAFHHYSVEAESSADAREKAAEMAESDLDRRWDISKVTKAHEIASSK